MRDLPIAAWLYSAAVAMTAAVAVLSYSLDSGAPSLPVTLAFAALFLVADFTPVWFRHVSYSVGSVVAMCAVIVAGPAAAAAAASAAAIDRELFSRKDWLPRIMINAGALSLSTLALGRVYQMTGGPAGSISGRDFPFILVPLFLGTAAFFLTNTTLVSLMVALARRIPAREVWQSDYRRAVVTHFLFAALGVIFAALHGEIGWLSAPLVIFPLIGARQAFHTSEQIRVRFDATVGSLVEALEAKDPYTRGHAERVGNLSRFVARSYGLSEKQAEKIRFAALMHDIGKTTVDTRVLQKPGKLTSEEYDHMKVHSARGASLLEEIDMMRDMVDGVRHHHERFDGGGYPDGLSGEDLSVVARIITVSDAFDSMTSTRSYRRAMPMEKALAEIKRCEGTQFDPAMVAALEKAIVRFGWEPAPEPYEGETTPRPEVSPHHAMERAANEATG